MNLQLRINLQQRLTLLQELGLCSKFYESFLVRSEELLKKSKHQCGLMLLERDATEYHGVLDWLHATLSPSWRPHILAYYSGEGPKLGEMIEWGAISQLDWMMAQVILELTKSYRNLQQEGWLVGRGTPEPSQFLRRLTTDAVRALLMPLFSPAPKLAA